MKKGQPRLGSTKSRYFFQSCANPCCIRIAKSGPEIASQHFRSPAASQLPSPHTPRITPPCPSKPPPIRYMDFLQKVHVTSRTLSSSGDYSGWAGSQPKLPCLGNPAQACPRRLPHALLHTRNFFQGDAGALGALGPWTRDSRSSTPNTFSCSTEKKRADAMASVLS